MFDTIADLHLYRLLWAHAARRVIQTLPNVADYEIISIGYGTGLRHPDTRRAFLVHPSGNGSSSGDLSLSIPGETTHPIPRYGQSYPDYMATVADIVETTARSYLSGIDTDEPVCTSSSLE